MPRRSQPAFAVVLLSVGLLPSGGVFAGTIRHDRSDALYTGLAAESRFDAVGRFSWVESSGSFLASGVLISSEWVLTAAHVVDGTNGLGAGISNLNFFLDGSARSAAQWIPHPNWAASGGENNLFAGWDIALVRLGQPITEVAPATLYTDRDELTQTATIVGFGATGTGLTGATQPSGTKRAGQNVIDAVGTNVTPGSVISPPTDRLVTIDFDQPGAPGASTLGGSTPLNLEYLTAPGDSGGGLFLESEGETRLAAVTSLGSSFSQINSDYGDRASFTRVSSFIDWIETTTGLNLTSPMPGDFNGDGSVDTADFALWQAQFGATGSGFAADGNGDNVVDGADYALWRNNLVTTPGSASQPISSALSAVPESSAAFVAILAACAGTLFRWRHA
ncbi:MAG: trypsin-like serine protease [Planctomycetota bacterium]